MVNLYSLLKGSPTDSSSFVEHIAIVLETQNDLYVDDAEEFVELFFDALEDESAVKLLSFLLGVEDINTILAEFYEETLSYSRTPEEN